MALDLEDKTSASPFQAFDAVSPIQCSLPEHPPLRSNLVPLRDGTEDSRRRTESSSSMTIRGDEDEHGTTHNDDITPDSTVEPEKLAGTSELRGSSRSTKGQYASDTTQRYGFVFALLSIALLAAKMEPKNVRKARGSVNWKKWLAAMKQELISIEGNKTWILVPRPGDRKVHGGKWVYKLKRGPNGEILRHKAR